jgi:hypothetical protein
MSLDPLLEIIYEPNSEDWSERNKAAFKCLFGSPQGRYKQSAAAEFATAQDA